MHELSCFIINLSLKTLHAIMLSNKFLFALVLFYSRYH